MERLTIDNLAEFSNEFQRGLFVISRYAGYLTLTLEIARTLTAIGWNKTGSGIRISPYGYVKIYTK